MPLMPIAPSRGVIERSRSASRRSMARASSVRPFMDALRIPGNRSQFVSPSQRDDGITRPPRQREDGPGGILVGLRYERRAIGDEEIRAVVRPAARIHDRRPWIAAHARAAQLVDDRAA